MPAGDVWFKAARFTLIALLMAAPLAFGAVTAWGWASVTVVAVVIAVLWAVGSVRSGKVQLLGSPLLIPGFLLLAVAVAQFATGMSQDCVATRESIIKLITDLLLFFLTLQLFSDASPKIWHWTGFAVSAYASAISLFAIIQFFSSPKLVYWTIKPRWGGYIFGPYISHNNYAGLMEMVIPLCIATILSLRARHPLKPFLLFAIVTTTASLLLSGSRGGLVASVVELVLFAVLVIRCRAMSGRRVAMAICALGVLLTAGASFVWLDAGDVWNRWEAVGNSPEISLGFRDKMLVGAMRMTRANWKFGVGLGAFGTAYPKYQTLTTDLVIDHAHNDYAEIAAETGILGFGIVGMLGLLFVRNVSREIFHHMSAPQGWFPIAAAVGCCGLAVHSFSDFNLHIPANAAWFSICLGWAVMPTRRVWFNS